MIVTSDNPRTEEPEAILAEILEGTGSAVESEVDRRKAITQALGSAQEGDVVVIAGKGHEQGQEFEGGRKEPFDDVEGGARGSARHVTTRRQPGREAAGGDAGRRRARCARPRARRVIDTREAGRATCSSACPGRAPTAAVRARGARGRRLGRARGARARRARRGRHAARRP